MNRDWLQKLENNDPGFRPVLSFGAWRVAIANSSDWDTKPQDLPFWQKHNETDEAFCLLDGRCMIFVAGTGEAPGVIEAEDLKPGCLYNVRKGVWHARTLDPGSRILIVENDDTGRDNSDDSATTDEQKKAMAKTGGRTVHMINRNRETEAVPIADGVTRKVLSHVPAGAVPGMMAAEMRFEQGSVGAPHTHPHEQIGYVVSGRFELDMDGNIQELEAGDTYYVPPDVRHGVVALTDGVLLDVFAPMREDFV